VVTKIRINGREIGEGEPVFIIAEAGVNHNGDMALAKRLVQVAKEAGADAVKFQTFKTEGVVSKKAEMAEYQKESMKSSDSQYDLIKALELDYDCFIQLKEYCDEVGILFLSTPHSDDAVEFLDSLVPIHKIGSGDLTNLPFLEYVASYNKPIIISTGMATLEEVEEAVSVIRKQGNEQIILLHCVTSYPASIDTLNLAAMATIRESFSKPVGFSDHTVGITASIAAVALGASVIEKHFTVDKTLPGPDHKASLEPEELTKLVEAIREVESAIGDGKKVPVDSEQEMRRVARKSVVALMDISKDTLLTEEMIAIRRPGHGIYPKEFTSVIGKRTKLDIKVGEVLTWDMVK